jgi:hypothetical protein
MPTELRQTAPERNKGKTPLAGSSVVARASKVRGGGTDDRCSKARRRDGDGDPAVGPHRLLEGKKPGQTDGNACARGPKGARATGEEGHSPREAGRLAPVHSFAGAWSPLALFGGFGHRGATHLISGQKSDEQARRRARTSDPFRSNADQHSNAHHRKAVCVCVRRLFRSLLHGMGRDALVLVRCESVGGAVQVADSAVPLPRHRQRRPRRLVTYVHVHVRAYTA